jgi:alkyl sulfatase BDS1-like metallo-beta-lactamase superfamily hydrolase
MKISNYTQIYIFFLLAGCGGDITPPGQDFIYSRFPSEHTLLANSSSIDHGLFDSDEDFNNAKRGMIALAPEIGPPGHDGKPIWDRSDNLFATTAAPDTVNPILWRQARLNSYRGLFEVEEGIFQIRGFDLANMTLIKSENGWIILDPLTTIESTKAALDFAELYLGTIIPTAIIISHSHIDHFGGIHNVIGRSDDDDLPIITPSGFLYGATSENILAGPAMARRAAYMMGLELETSALGHVDSGLGKRVISGSTSITKPNIEISKSEEALIIDGINFIFFNMPESEAPAELTFYLPEKRVFCGAEIVSRTMHNVLTLRGAKVRDAFKWSEYIAFIIDRLPDVETLFISHHWPTWGHNEIVQQLEEQQDLYRFIHDQTLRLANKGLTPREIAEELRLPPNLARASHVQGYYGTLSHNAKAVYQYYFGWYDGNPAHLHQLPSVDSAPRYVSLMGGPDTVLNYAEEAVRNGEYRWAAELLNHLIFSASAPSKASDLLAYVYTQMGYQSESGVWRDIFLSAAQELRQGINYRRDDIDLAAEFIREISLDSFLQSMAVNIDPDKASGKTIKIKVDFIDKGRTFLLFTRNSVLHFREIDGSEPADASLVLTHQLFIDMLIGKAGIKEIMLSDDLSFEGSIVALLKFFSLFGEQDTNFNIVTP